MVAGLAGKAWGTAQTPAGPGLPCWGLRFRAKRSITICLRLMEILLRKTHDFFHEGSPKICQWVLDGCGEKQSIQVICSAD